MALARIAVLLALACEPEPDSQRSLAGTWERSAIPGAEGFSFSVDTWRTEDGNIWSIAMDRDPAMGLEDPTVGRWGVVQFDGERWALHDVRNDVVLRGVWASSGDDVWVSMSIVDGTVTVRAAGLLHWDGTAWTEMVLPSDVDPRTGWPLWGASRGEPWLIDRGRILRLDGSSLVELIDFRDRFTPDRSKRSASVFIDSICGDAADDAWVSASVQPVDATGFVSTLLHWDGAGWTENASPSASVYCGGPQLWAAIDDSLARRDTDGWYLFPADTFEVVGFAPGHPDSFYIRDLLVRDTDDVWIVGTRSAAWDTDFEKVRDELWHHDGSQVSMVVIPSAADAEGFSPQAIAGGPEGPVWILGQDGMLLHFTPEGR